MRIGAVAQHANNTTTISLIAQGTSRPFPNGREFERRSVLLLLLLLGCVTQWYIAGQLYREPLLEAAQWGETGKVELKHSSQRVPGCPQTF